MAHWDELVEQDSTVKSVADYCGCILPNQVDIIAFPNNHRFILHPIEHAGSYHIVEQAAKAGQSSVPKKRPSDPAPQTFSKKASDTIIQTSSSTMSTHNQCTSTSGNGKVTVTGKLKYRHKNISSLIDPKISMGTEAKDDFDTWAQDYALSVVLSGTNKYLPQAAIVHLYNSAFEGVKGYHDVLLGKIEIVGKKIAPPPKVALNEHTISSLQNSLLGAFKIIDKTELNESPYQKLKNSFGKYYSIFNGGIQKFSMELNGMMV